MRILYFPLCFSIDCLAEHAPSLFAKSTGPGCDRCRLLCPFSGKSAETCGCLPKLLLMYKRTQAVRRAAQVYGGFVFVVSPTLAVVCSSGDYGRARAPTRSNFCLLFFCDGRVLFDARPQATNIARAMVTQYGMSEKVGKVYMKDHQKEGPEMRATVDSEVKLELFVIHTLFKALACVRPCLMPTYYYYCCRSSRNSSVHILGSLCRHFNSSRDCHRSLVLPLHPFAPHALHPGQ